MRGEGALGGEMTYKIIIKEMRGDRVGFTLRGRMFRFT